MNTNNPVDLVISFDNTGSMSSCLSEVRNRCEETIRTLFQIEPDLRVAIAFHGNYANRSDGAVYLSEFFDSDYSNSAIKFINSSNAYYSQTSGGSSRGFTHSSCSATYEVVLRELNLGFQDLSQVQWRDNSKKILVMIGDEEPSHLSYGIDYRVELKKLVDRGLTVFGVECLNGQTWFYKDLAEKSKGTYLKLAQFRDIVELITAVAHSSGPTGDDNVLGYAQVLKDNKRLTRSLYEALKAISKSVETIDPGFAPLDYDYYDISGRTNRISATHSNTKGLAAGLVPVDPSRFQVIDVGPNRVPIQDLVNGRGLHFKPGMGFYEWIKSEKIQARKEVVLRDKISGDMFSGQDARDMIGVQYGEKKTLSPKTSPIDTDKYTVFIQSTSFNRKLDPNTEFLYEVNHI